MSTDIYQGAPQFPTTNSTIAPSSREVIDKAIQELQEHKEAWVRTSVRERIILIDTLIKDFSALASRWVASSMQAKGISAGSLLEGEEWGAGTWALLNNLRQVRQVLLDIETHGQVKAPGPVTTRSDGQVIAQVFPFRTYDKLLFTGVKAEVWMQAGITAEELPNTQAVVYGDKTHRGKVTLVLGAGNVASIGPLDLLYKLFVEDHVVLFKANPVNAYLGPLLTESFQSLITPGYLRIIYGGASEGAYACNHIDIDEIHITGSDKTFDTIVFGGGAEGAKRKQARQPLLQKRITAELGNVSPVIVVPGPWSISDLAYQATHIVSMLTNNAGFNCNATRVIIQHENWAQRDLLLQEICRVLAHIPTRNAYYPGAHQRYQSFIRKHPDAEQYGVANEQQLPWTLIANVDPQEEEDICFTTEAFCGLFAETALEANSITEYIQRAVTFANENLWGTLSATILVHPASLKDPAVTAAVEQAIADMRYGSIGVNYWGGISFILGSTTWGAFPGHDIYDIQSGNNVVHNSLMFSQPQKSVIRAPFRSMPKPPWFVDQGKVANKIFPKLVRFETNPSPWKLPEIVLAALGL